MMCLPRRQGEKLDWALIEQNGRMLAEVAENDELVARRFEFRDR